MKTLECWESMAKRVLEKSTLEFWNRGMRCSDAPIFTCTLNCLINEYFDFFIILYYKTPKYNFIIPICLNKTSVGFKT